MYQPSLPQGDCEATADDAAHFPEPLVGTDAVVGVPGEEVAPNAAAAAETPLAGLLVTPDVAENPKPNAAPTAPALLAAALSVERPPVAVPSQSVLSVCSKHPIGDEMGFRRSCIDRDRVPLSELSEFLGNQLPMLGDGCASRMHSLEIWAEKARVIRSVWRHGGRSIMIGLPSGHDLRRKRHRELVSFTFSAS